MMQKIIPVAISLIIILPHIHFRFWQNLPVLDKPEPFYQLHNLWTHEELASLRQLLKSQKVYRSAAQDVTCRAADLEVTAPLQPNGKCPHTYLVPNQNGTCQLPGRVDMFQHYSLTGGKYGAKEPLFKLISNVQSFQRYLFGKDLERPEFQSLFNSDQYIQAAKGVCGPEHPVYERVQVNLIIMLPGQDLPMHYDLPWFQGGANRFNLPQWLLLAMAGSGLWQDELLPQVQGVAYVHSSQDLKSGDFFLYPNGPGGEAVSVKSQANTGIVLDGIKVIHGVERFWPSRTAPTIGKGHNQLIYEEEEDLWHLINEHGTTVTKYKTEDLRISLVWRSICFRNEQHRRDWDPENTVYDGQQVLDMLEEDLKTKGVLLANQRRHDDPVEFALTLVKTYVQYPVDNWRRAWFPLNYCIAPQAVQNPMVKGLLQLLTILVC